MPYVRQLIHIHDTGMYTSSVLPSILKHVCPTIVLYSIYMHNKQQEKLYNKWLKESMYIHNIYIYIAKNNNGFKLSVCSSTVNKQQSNHKPPPQNIQQDLTKGVHRMIANLMPHLSKYNSGYHLAYM